MLSEGKSHDLPSRQSVVAANPCVEDPTPLSFGGSVLGGVVAQPIKQINAVTITNTVQVDIAIFLFSIINLRRYPIADA